jgi:large subunit ribosomal protein L6
MSRLAAKPIAIDSSVKIDIAGEKAIVKGPKGELEVVIQEGVELEVGEKGITVKRKDDSKRAFQGLVWSMLNNAVIGVTKGFSKKLEIVGKGWRCTVKGDVINLQVGYSHPVEFQLPKGVTAQQENPVTFTLASHDKQLLGQTCANIQKVRPVEPYKLKGIRIEGQYLRQKVRKTAGV